MLKLSIVIVSWNTTDFLIKCLESIFENSPECAFEIIVVDNDSADDISPVKKLFPKIRLIKSAYNYGFGVGTNIGFRLASGEYVMTLNPDTQLISGTIDELVSVLEHDERVGIAVPVLKGQKVKKSHYSFFSLFFNSVIIRKFRDVTAGLGGEENAPFDVEFTNGTGYVCRTSALAENRFFSEDNFLFGEEYYLCRQITEKNYKIRVVPAARFEHHSGVTFKNDPERLKMVTKLGASVGWRIRKQQWGSFTGVVSNLLLGLESAAKWAVATLGKFFPGNAEAEELQRARSVNQAKATVLAYLPMFSDETKSLAEANEQSELFFNNGRKPVNPPVFEEIV